MSNALTIFNQQPQLPADVASFFEEESNIAPKATVPSLTYEGKVWSIGLNGEKTKLMRRNQDGDEEAVSVMRVVVLDYAKRRGRAYYPGAYDPAKVAMPDCFSHDGVDVDPVVKKKAADDGQGPFNGWTGKCEGCPMAAKGSKITDNGKAVVACSQHRMLVVVPANKLDFQPLRMKIAITSDWDQQSPDHEAAGWYAFQNYTDMLRANNVPHTARIVTKMKFDPNVAYPKVLFSPDRFLSEDELRSVIPVVKSSGVKQLLDGTWTPNGADGVQAISAPTQAPAPKAAAPAPAPTPAPAPAPAPVAAQVEDEAEDADYALPGQTAAPAPAPKATPAPKARGPKPSQVVSSGAAEAKVEAPAAPAAANARVAALLDEWGD